MAKQEEQEISALSVEGALFSTPRHRIEAHSESIVSSASYASSVSSLGFREPCEQELSPESGFLGGKWASFNGIGVWFFGLVWREALFVDLSGDIL